MGYVPDVNGRELVEWAEEEFAGEDLFVAEPPARNVKTVRDAMVALEVGVLARSSAPSAERCGLDELLALRADRAHGTPRGGAR